MKKILSLICLMMLAVTSAWAGEVATFDLGTKNGVSTPAGFFKSVGTKWNWNDKFAGGEYNGKTYSTGLKMEGDTKIGFTTEYVSTVTIVQSTWGDGKTITLDGTELAVADAIAGTGCRIYTVEDVAAGDHVIGRGSGESGLFYVKVEWTATKTVTFINDANWEKVNVYAWDKDNNAVTDPWPGNEMTEKDAEGNFTWSTTADPVGIIFNNGTSQTADLEFKDGGVYKSTGRVITLNDYTVTFTTDGMEEVWAYVWNGDEKVLGDWPGTKMEAVDGHFEVAFQAEDAPKFIIFNNNAGEQTPDWEFVNGKDYEYMLSEFTATFTTDAEWENVYAYAWSGTGDAAKKYLGDWPGTALTDGAISFKAFVAPESIIFNGGEGNGQTPDLGFNNGRAYKWNTKLQPLYALEAGGAAIPAGTTVEVKDADGDVVATVTYGVDGGKEFAAPQARANDEYAGFTAFTGGNGDNGTADGGTVYYIKPVYDGTVTVGVWLNGGKALYIEEDGTPLEGFNGLKKDYGSGTAFTFDVKAGSTYAVYCTGSKLGFYGFDYTFDKPGTVPVEITSMAIVGTILGLEATEGEEDPNWDPANGWPMTKNEDGTWSLVKEGVTLKAGEYEFKATANGNWKDYVLPEGDNAKWTIETDGEYDITFSVNVEYNDFAYTFTPVVQPLEITSMAIVGDFLGLEATEEDENPNWNPANGWAMKQDSENPAIWTLTKLFVAEAKTYYYKATANGNWDDYVLPAGDNADYNFDTSDLGAGKYVLTFTVNTEEHTIVLDAQKVPAVEIPEGAIVFDFEGAAYEGENPDNLNGSAANGQAFYGWEKADKTDSYRQDYKGYTWKEGSVLPEVCQVWRRQDRINGNVKDFGLYCPNDREMAIDGLEAGCKVIIAYDALDATNKEMIWAIGTPAEGPRATATIAGVEAVSGETTIASGAEILVNSVTPAPNGTGYIVVKVMKGMYISQVIIIPAPKKDVYTATFTTNAGWDEVYAYTWTTEGDVTTEQLGAWPGTKLEATDGVYTVEIEGETAPANIIFNNGDKGAQTEDLVFEDGNAYEYTISDEWAAAIAAAEALVDEEAVAVGKLINAINVAQGQTGTDEDKAALQAAVDQFKLDNADQEKDETAKVATDGWKKFETNDAAGVCDPKYAPTIDTYDGRTNVKMAEVWENTCATTGQIIYQNITGLQNGQYKVGFYANAFSTAKRDGMACDLPEEGADDVAYVFANNEKAFVNAIYATETSENSFRTFDVEVTDGNIKLGMGKEKAGTNWHIIQIYQLTWFTTAKEVYAELNAELGKLLEDALTLMNDETKTEGKEALRLAYGEGSAAYNSNWYNIPEMEDKVNALKQAIADFTKANYYIDFVAGEYYIIHAQEGKMMAAGNQYGTHGIINDMGLDLTLTPYEESRTVTIDSRVSNGGDNHFLGVNMYMDSSEWGWALEYQGFGFYIKDPDGGKYINIDSDFNLVLSDTPCEWIIVSKEGVIWLRLDEMSEATAENPVDATWLLQNPNFNRNDQRVSAWEFTPMGDAESNPENWNNHNFNGGKDENRCAESFHAAFTTMQTVSGAPAGKYELTAQGFYRQDDEVVEDAPQFFANGVNKDVPAMTGSEGNMGDASASFTKGDYTIEPIEFEVAAEGDDAGMIYVGIYTNATHQWVIWDNFVLTYYGPADDTTGISEVNTSAESNAAIFNLAGQKVTKAQKGLYIVNGKKVVKK